MTEQTPSITIDDALRLFLQLVNPSGLQDGPETDALLEHMRNRVAADRPEWAAASEPSLPPPTPPEAASEYAQTKANIVAAAGVPEVPTDPMERAIWNDRQQARQHAEQRRADARDDEARERLRRRAIDEQHECDEATLERALRIRRILELKLAALAPAQPLAPSVEPLGPLASSAPSLEFSQSNVPERVALTAEDRIELMRAYNLERRALLQHREDLITRRGLDHRKDDDERMRMSTDAPARPNSKRSRTRTWDLQLD